MCNPSLNWSTKLFTAWDKNLFHRIGNFLTETIWKSRGRWEYLNQTQLQVIVFAVRLSLCPAAWWHWCHVPATSVHQLLLYRLNPEIGWLQPDQLRDVNFTEEITIFQLLVVTQYEPRFGAWQGQIFFFPFSCSEHSLLSNGYLPKG